jgi:hypothetical protein
MTGTASREPGPVVLVVVDDEPIVTDSVRWHLQRPEVWSSVEVHGFDRPRRLGSFTNIDLVTHAVVDLSFGRDDIDGPQSRPEVETGVDAIDLLQHRCLGCKIVVATRNDSDLVTEMAVAIRQTWPQIVFFHKGDSRLRRRIEDFVIGNHYQDNAEIALDLIGVEPVAPERLRRAIEATARARPGARLVLALAELPTAPTRQELAAHLGGKADTYVRSLTFDLTAVLIEWGLLQRDQGGGIGRLWMWARARRAILRRELEGLIGSSPVTPPAT